LYTWVQFIGQQPESASQPSKAKVFLPSRTMTVGVRAIDAWLETASSTAGGSVEAQRWSRYFSVRERSEA